MTLLLPFLSFPLVFWLPENKCPADNCVKAGKKKALITGWLGLKERNYNKGISEEV
jgi:hypothetical protein